MNDVAALDEAVCEAKRKGGVDPDAPCYYGLFIAHLPEEWHRPFWERQIQRTIEAEKKEA